jgi:hypothetical protein
MKKDLFSKIKKKYSQVGSWAIWAEASNSDTSNIKIFDIKTNKDLLTTLHTRYIFVALNISSPIDKARPFGNFHGGKRDFMLRDAVKGTPLWGAYMTDIIKFHPEVNSTAVLRYFNKNPQELKSHFDHFKQEITDLGTTENTQVIALGVLAYKLLLKAKLSNKLFKLTHYSSPTLSKLAYQQEVSSLLEKLEA